MDNKTQGRIRKTQTLEEMVGSIALRSRTRLPSLQKVKLARGSNSPGSVHRHLTSGPIFSITSNLTIPPSTRSSSPTLTSASSKMFSQFRTQKSQSKMFFFTSTSFFITQNISAFTFRKTIIAHTDGTCRSRRIKGSNSECPNLTILQNVIIPKH